jgi:hypothetical protein
MLGPILAGAGGVLGAIGGFGEARAKAKQRKSILKLLRQELDNSRRRQALAMEGLRSGEAGYLNDPDRLSRMSRARSALAAPDLYSEGDLSTMRHSALDQASRGSAIAGSNLRQSLANRGLSRSGVAAMAESSMQTNALARAMDLNRQTEMGVKEANVRRRDEVEEKYGGMLHEEALMPYQFGQQRAALLGSFGSNSGALLPALLS